MSYQVLARKWRPKIFADLVGQEHVVRALSNALDQNRLHHAYLLTGTRGVGKTTIARILAKSLNCEAGISSSPCCSCSTCHQIDSGRFVDLLEIDAASNTGIDNIREVLENAQYAPSAGRFKVYIIDEVHMLSKAAFNAMLKTLEEPPEHVKFILATTDPQKVPVTVLSRCLQFSLRNMSAIQIAGHLAHVLDDEQISYQPSSLPLLARSANGSMRDALSLLDQSIAYGVGQVEESSVRAMLGSADRKVLFNLLDCLVAADAGLLLKAAGEMISNGIGFDSALSDLASLLHQIALAQVAADFISDEEPEKISILGLASKFDAEELQLYYQIALHGRKDLSLAPDEASGFLMTLLRMLSFVPQWQAAKLDLPPQISKPQVAKIQPAELITTDKVIANNKADFLDKKPDITDDLLACEIFTDKSAAINLTPVKHISNLEEVTKVNLPIPKLSGNAWLQLIQQLTPQLGSARMLASNTVLHAQNDDCWCLHLDPSFKHFLTRDLVDKFSSVLSSHFGKLLRVDIKLDEHGVETPIMESERTKETELNNANKELQKDLTVQALQKEFGAVILPETLQSLI